MQSAARGRLVVAPCQATVPTDLRTCCSPIYRTGTCLPSLLVIATPEDALAQEDSFSRVPKSAMSKVGEEGFGLLKPVVDWQVIVDLAAKFSSAAFCVLPGVSHDYTS
jgi:hypothetical protein